MYYVRKTFEISAAHHLNLNYESKCTNLHGHNWKIVVYCKADELNENGMVIDFTTIKRLIQDELDHKYLNQIIENNPTAENMARWICEMLDPICYKVQVQESEGNVAIYEVEE